MVGTWSLVGIDGPPETLKLRGSSPRGMIVYDANGYMTVQIAPGGGDKELAGAPFTAAQAADRLASYSAYFGVYTVDLGAGTITHHRVCNVKPTRLTAVVRRYEMRADGTLALRPLENNNTLVWRRLT